MTPVDGQDNTYNVEPAEGTVYSEGTLLNAKNLNNETMNLIGEIVSDGWNSSKSYTVGDSCIYNNMLWNCLVANTNVAPTEGTYWTRVQLAKADYVVDRGTSGSWKYVKWASGEIELWASIGFTGLNLTSQSSGTYYGTSKTITVPVVTYVDNVQATETNRISSHNSGVFIHNVSADNGGNILGFDFRSFASYSNVSCTLFLEVKGRWK